MPPFVFVLISCLTSSGLQVAENAIPEEGNEGLHSALNVASTLACLAGIGFLVYAILY